MRYLIHTKKESFLSDVAPSSLMFLAGITVYNLLTDTYTVDGINWLKLNKYD